MARAKLDPEILAHLEWIGFVRPTGLVVSAPALVRAGAILERRDMEGQRLLKSCVEDRAFNPSEGPVPCLSDFRVFAQTVLGWSFSAKGYAGTDENPVPPELELPLPDYGETLSCDFAVREPDPREGVSDWQLLVQVLEPGQDFDRVIRGGRHLEASPHGRMERLLRSTGVPAGLLFNGRALRLLSAPRGESSGWLDFRVADMVQTAGRPISTALRLLLSQPRLLSLPRPHRLAALLEDSRKFQNEVSERLAQQVLHALYELLRGFQAAHEASRGALLREPLAEHPDQVYRALLSVILRLVFLLYAEERDMLPEDETWLRYYSLAGLYERLREDAALFPDTMDQRFGGWAQLLVLFRMIYDGAEAGTMRLPKRHGVLFDPDRFPFLEGRAGSSARQIHERIEAPLVPDGTIYRALENLLVLDGERISYRALDVEQIGSVYETMMGFRLETTTGRSVAIKAQSKHGAPTAVDLEDLLAETDSKRSKWLQDRADRKLTDTIAKAIKSAKTLEDLHAALLPVIDAAATPDLVPKGSMVLQPSEERRRSGSHYTPRELTHPIVRKTLEPILARLGVGTGDMPRPEEILDLKVCDPAMGSGAFLVEVCRQLGDALVDAWRAYDETPAIPPDEDEVIFARRLIAQRCLFGVDRNPVAVDLAKVSLWLVTLAKDHALTFVDHALRHGDSLVGLSRRQIEAFQWVPSGAILRGFHVREPLEHVSALRQRIREADENVSDWERRDLWDEAQAELGKIRLVGDLLVAAFFEGDKPKERGSKRAVYASAITSGEAEVYRAWLEERRQPEHSLVPFHWEIEFPEVFEREKPGFNAIVGNPPFLAGKNISGTLGGRYLDWLRLCWPDAKGQVDLVAFFFRRSFELMRKGAALGLLATNTIAQGDTRAGGLLALRKAGAHIYYVVRRLPWLGIAAVLPSRIHLSKNLHVDECVLDGVRVPLITAFLSSKGSDEDPIALRANAGRAFSGYYNYGDGFLFDDAKTGASSLVEMKQIVSRNPKNADLIHPFIGGDDLLNSPAVAKIRFVIDFGTLSIEEAAAWPDLLEIVRRKVMPERQKCNRERLRERWWQFGETRPGLRKASRSCSRLLMIPFTAKHFVVGIVQGDFYIASPHVAIAMEQWSSWAVLQSRPHEFWARFFGSSLEDRLRYTPSDCFETFPFPDDWDTRPALEVAGKAYYEFRAALMVRNDEGLTKTYNRFHDPEESAPDILQLRELHAAMDRAVLDAYGWSDIVSDCEFLLDYEINEEKWSPRRRKPYRYRWPDEVHDEVLARLLELNANRAREESRAGVSAVKKHGQKARNETAFEQSQSKDLFS